MQHLLRAEPARFARPDRISIARPRWIRPAAPPRPVGRPPCATSLFKSLNGRAGNACHFVIPSEQKLRSGHKKRAGRSRGRPSSRTLTYWPFWQTSSFSPWKVNSPFTEVFAGAPKYGSVTRSCRSYWKPFSV